MTLQDRIAALEKKLDVAREKFEIAQRKLEAAAELKRLGRPPRSRSPESLARIEEMKRLRASGLTLAEIGAQKGVTSERVRQLIKSMPMPPKPRPWPRRYFCRVMKQWLWDAGYRKCSYCETWTSDMSPRSRRCRDCNRRAVRAYYRSERGKEKQRQWRAANPDLVRAATERWAQKNRGKSTNKPLAAQAGQQS